MNRKALLAAAALFAALPFAQTAIADPIEFPGDEGYTRLARWEAHLDARIASGVQQGWLAPDRAWHLQKQLDDVELHAVAVHFENQFIDRPAFHHLAQRLSEIAAQLGENDWSGWDWQDQPPPPPQGYGPPPPPPPQDSYYQPGAYEENCHRGNAAAGTIFGAIGGGLIGGLASHGNGAAIAGGVVLGGLVGNALSRDIDCEDHPYAFAVYDQAFNGELGREYRWQHGDHYGTIVATREFTRGDGRVCRDFHAVNYHNGERIVRDGTACRGDEGHWHFQ